MWITHPKVNQGRAVGYLISKVPRGCKNPVSFFQPVYISHTTKSAVAICHYLNGGGSVLLYELDIHNFEYASSIEPVKL